MYGEDGLAVDLEEVIRVVGDADVLIVGFAICRQRLLIDLRGDDVTGPMVELVEPLASAQERAIWLSARRPSLGLPERTAFFGWPHSAALLEQTGMLRRVATRALQEHGVELDEEIATTLAELRQLERDLTRDAIRGEEGFETLWSAHSEL